MNSLSLNCKQSIQRSQSFQTKKLLKQCCVLNSSSRPPSIMSNHGFAPHNGSISSALLVTVEPNVGMAHLLTQAAGVDWLLCNAQIKRQKVSLLKQAAI